MNKVLGSLLSAAILFTSGTVVSAASPVEQQIAYAAMQRNNPELLQAVQTMIATDFLGEVVDIVKNQGETCDAAAADKAAKIKCFARDFLIKEHSVNFQNGWANRKKWDLQIRSVAWDPGQREARLKFAFRTKSSRGVNLNCNGEMTVDVKLWQVRNVSNCDS